MVRHSITVIVFGMACTRIFGSFRIMGKWQFLCKHFVTQNILL
jgi:hypothetical protein